MKKKIIVIIVSCFIIIIFFVILLVYKNSKKSELILPAAPTAERRACEKAGGRWYLFGSICVGRCHDRPVICGEAMTWGCDCGEKCWNGSKCIVKLPLAN